MDTSEKHYTMFELFKSGRIHWIKSFPTLRKWILRDMSSQNLLGVKIISTTSGKTGVRYFIPSSNVEKFIASFNNKTLFSK